MRIAEIFHSVQGEGVLTGVESLFVRASGCKLRCRFCDTPYASWQAEGEDLAVARIVARLHALEALAAGRRGPRFHMNKQQSRLAGKSRLLDDALGNSARAQHSVCAPVVPDGRRRRRMVRHVVITGGEPMLHDDLPRLCELLRAEGRHVTIETSGTRYLAVACDLISISPKLSNSTPWGLVPLERIRRHERVRRAATAVIARLMAEHEYQLKFVIDRPEDFPEVEAYLSALPAVNRERVMLMPQGVAVEELAEKARWLEPYCRAHRLQFCPRRQIEWFGGERGK